MRKIRRNDQVVVIAGRDKGHRGEVLRIVSDNQALVSGANLIKKHTRPNPNRNEKGGIVEKESPVHLSNLAIWNAEQSRPDRVGLRVENGKKVRFFKSSGKAIDESSGGE